MKSFGLFKECVPVQLHRFWTNGERKIGASG